MLGYRVLPRRPYLVRGSNLSSWVVIGFPSNRGTIPIPLRSSNGEASSRYTIFLHHASHRFYSRCCGVLIHYITNDDMEVIADIHILLGAERLVALKLTSTWRKVAAYAAQRAFERCVALERLIVNSEKQVYRLGQISPSTQ